MSKKLKSMFQKYVNRAIFKLNTKQLLYNSKYEPDFKNKFEKDLITLLEKYDIYDNSRFVLREVEIKASVSIDPIINLKMIARMEPTTKGIK